MARSLTDAQRINQRLACEAELGARGMLIATSVPDGGNRKTVIRWLTAQRFGSRFCNKLTLAELAFAYNDRTNAALDALRVRDLSGLEEDKDEAEDDEEVVTFTDDPVTAPAPAPAPTVSTNGHAAPPPPAPTGGIEDAFQTIRDAINARPAGLDESQVRVIIRDEIAAIPPKAHVITINNAAPVLLEERLHQQFDLALRVVARNRPLFLVGPAGSGKTTLAEQLAKAIGSRFFMLGALSGAHQLMGYEAFGKYYSTPFREAFEHGGTFLLDEIDGSLDASPLLALNSALANGYAAFPDSVFPVKRHPDFRCIAAANTWGRGADRLYVGRVQLDGSSLDRFSFLPVDYDEQLERDLSGNVAWARRVQSLRAAAQEHKAQVIISPRATFMGAEYLADGMLQTDVENMLIWKGLEAGLRSRIEFFGALNPSHKDHHHGTHLHHR